MDSSKLYDPAVLRNKVPTLHPRYQWMKLELEPDDRIVLTTISGRHTVEHVIELTGLPEDSVARVILKLVGRGVVLWDDDLPFYDEAALLEVVPTFDPQNTNRNAHLDDTDRMLLTLINGRTSVRQMEAALPLSRDRLFASVIRLRLADVIGVVDAGTKPVDARAEAAAAVTSYQVPESSAAPRQAPAAPPPAASAPPPAPPQPATSSVGTAASAPEPSAPKAYKTRQDAFEEATRRLLSGESLAADVSDPTATPAPRKGTGPVRDHEPPRYERKTGRAGDKKESKKTRTAEVRARAAAEPAANPGSRLPVIAIGGLIAAALVVGGLALGRGKDRANLRGGHQTIESFHGIIELSQILPRQSGKFQAQVAPSWFQMSSAAKRQSVRGMATALDADGVKAIVLTDDDGRIVAEWEDGALTLHE